MPTCSVGSGIQGLRKDPSRSHLAPYLSVLQRCREKLVSPSVVHTSERLLRLLSAIVAPNPSERRPKRTQLGEPPLPLCLTFW
jgi:hypothetical protein